jgi:hypothetical protein
MRAPVRLTIVTALVALLAACSTEKKERNLTGMWSAPPQSAQASPPPTQPEPQQQSSRDLTVISVPESVWKQHTDFLDRRATLFGDTVEVDASRTGWFSSLSISVARDAVDRTDAEDAERGVTTITLARRADAPATKDSVPTVHFGNGLRVVGVDRVVLRFWTKQSAERPFWFQATAAGKKAVYEWEGKDEQGALGPPQRREGSRVVLRSEIRKENETYRFSESAEPSP